MKQFRLGFFQDVSHSLCLLLGFMVSKKLSIRKSFESALPLNEH